MELWTPARPNCRSARRLQRRQGTQFDDPRPLLQHQAHAELETAIRDNGRVRYESATHRPDRGVSRSGFAWRPEGGEVSAAGMGPALYQAVPQHLFANDAGSREPSRGGSG